MLTGPSKPAGTGEPLAGKLGAAVARFSADAIHAADEFGDERGAGLLVKLDRRAHLLELAAVHHDDLVAHRQRLGLVVRDEHRRDAEPLLDVADLVAHLVAQLGIEIRQRLVEQQDRWADDQRAGQRHALLLAAGQSGGAPRLPCRCRCTSATASRTRLAISSRATLRISRPKAMFLSTVICGNSA